MEAVIRKRFQGVTNILRFNWHFYAIAAAFIFLLVMVKEFLSAGYNWLLFAVILFILVTILVSLLVSFYVYDLSGLYELSWLNRPDINPSSKLVNINAGFDETSHLIKKRFPGATLRIVDFYDPSKHTEVSIKRARKAYAAHEGTESISTGDTFLPENSVDLIFLILAAHEIRDQSEREHFFVHLQKALKNDGEIIVVEHLRNLPNFLAYTIGFFHFFSENNWKEVFKRSGLYIRDQQNITPFITVFSLEKNGTAS